MRGAVWILGSFISAILFLSAAVPVIARISFKDVAKEAGIRFILDNSATPEKHQIETMIGGVAVFDYDNNGRPDIYFLNGARLPGMDKSDPKYWNRLYRNDGNGKFTDVTEAAGVKGSGYGMGVAVGDYDNDGFEDIYIAGVTQNQLLHNNGDGTFTDVTAKAGLSGVFPKSGKKPLAVGAGWFDYNNDGLLDLFVVNYLQWSIEHEAVCNNRNIRAYCSPDSYAGQPNMLFRNNGDGTFTDVSESSGIAKYIGKGMGVAFADYDGDGYEDVFVSNDTYRNFLFHNKGNGTFEEAGVVNGIAYNENGKSIAGMGADFRDIDNDGKPDIFVTGMTNDTFPLFRNAGDGFNDITSSSGVAAATGRLTGWSNGIFDFDNDGWKDLFTANSAILDNSEQIDGLPYLLPDLVLRNLGNSHFGNVSAGTAWAHPAALHSRI
ncbi:MAG: VCBS repeat-containing protein [Acidobacteriota bacterium]|nr:VCBS repeat-containing protein [Acidobacteriota bacterium]